MKLVTFNRQSREDRIGAIVEVARLEIVDVVAAARGLVPQRLYLRKRVRNGRRLDRRA